MDTNMKGAPTLVFLTIQAVGHLVPAVEMAKRLSDHFSITILTIRAPVADWADAMAPYIDSIASSDYHIRFIELPPIEFSFDRNQDVTTITSMSLFIEAHKTVVKSTVAELQASSCLKGVFIDFFCTAMIEVAADLGIPPYIYFTTSAAHLCLMLYLPILDVSVPSEMEDAHARREMVRIPGLTPLPRLAMPSTVMNKKSEDHAWLVHHARRLQEVKGIAINTFKELEPSTIQALLALLEQRCLPDHHTPPVYPVGPMLALQGEGKHECIKWLDKQPLGSVVLLCFGSMGCFDVEQVREIALGLERSGHRFLWCLRSSLMDVEIEEALPNGFLERTSERGMVWSSWVPQIEILSHEAVGGFVSHCGWNSCLESIWAGVPVLAWPLYAEQPLNAFEMAREIGSAVEMRVGSGTVAAEEVEKGLRCLMADGGVGKQVRERAKELKEMSRRAVGEKGSSLLALEELTQVLNNRGFRS